MTKVFTTSAKYYEVLSDNEKRLKREGPFLKETLQQAPGLRVVDMACGTGLHAEFFAKLGACGKSGGCHGRNALGISGRNAKE